MDHTDEQTLRQMYSDMYEAMIAKDTVALCAMMSEESALIHMTGMRQPRREYLQAIADGTLNYYSCTDSEIAVNVNGEEAAMTGKSKVDAAVFGGGRNTWPLRLDIDWKKREGKWIITEIRAGTY